MANKDDYLTNYRRFFEEFAQTVNPNDQLPVKLASYKLVNTEVVGGVIDWTTQYLTQKQCPESLIAPLIKIVIEEIRKSCKKHPIACGFNPADDAYEPLKLMQTVMAKTNDICLRYLDNSKLCSLPAPGPPHHAVTAYASRNARRRMEDRHVIVHDLNTMFNIQEATPSSYYAIFDGHAGHDAAAYSAAHLHQFLAESEHFTSNPQQALYDAFIRTDTLFLDKCRVENYSGGTTAVCILLRPKEQTLYVAWVGDSQALLVSQGRIFQSVQPHKPGRADEKFRIEQLGGFVVYWGTWRVMGQLAVSRAIGDSVYKPFVTAVPDIREISLRGDEDFIIIACDGLWDFLSEEAAARTVYNALSANSDDIDSISQLLVQLSKEQGSADNITVIVVFLREPSKIAAEARWANRNGSTMDAGLDNANAANNPFVNSNEILAQKDGFVLNLADGFKQNGTEKSPANEYFTERPANGKRSADEFNEDDDDFGPETDVDTVDDILLSPAIAAAKALAEGVANNNPVECFNPFDEKEEEKADSECEQKFEHFEPLKPTREETPTPPADSVQDASGFLDNVAESGDESEDEWNYFKGDVAEKENIPPSSLDKEVAELTEASDTMSQLNPNAAEFVPVSPTRNIASPPLMNLINDPVIAQSPKRASAPSDLDINVPNPQEFECEVRSRPSNIKDENEDEGRKLSTIEIMENLLNGRSIDEIEFQPVSSPVKSIPSDEFHFGPNAVPFSTPKVLDQSEISTKAVFGDESTASYLENKTLEGFDSSFIDSTTSSNIFASEVTLDIHKEQDPMSMSFYQDKDEENPFDLNKVQLLPDNIDDSCEKPVVEDSILCDGSITDLPEHDPLAGLDFVKPIKEEEEIIETTDLDRPAEGEISPENEKEDGELELMNIVDQILPPISPEPQLIEQENVSEVSLSKSPAFDEPLSLPVELVCQVPTKSPIPENLLQFELSEPQIVCSLPPSKSAYLESLSPEPSELQDNICERLSSISPAPIESKELKSEVPIPTKPEVDVDDMTEICKSDSEKLHEDIESPLDDVVTSSIKDDLSSPIEVEQIPEVKNDIIPVDEPISISENEFLNTIVEVKEEIVWQEPISVIENKIVEQIDDVIQNVEEEVKEEIIPKDEPVLETSSLRFAQELSDAVQENVNVEMSSPVLDFANPPAEDIQMFESCPILSPKSDQIETESVATTDVNSFLERSVLSEVASPLSPTEVQLQGYLMEFDVQRDVCPLPTDIEIKSEIITPEFAEEAIATPSEEHKANETITNEAQEAIEEKRFEEAPAASSPEVALEAKESDESAVAVAIAGAAIGAVAVATTATAAIVEKKTKPKTAVGTAKKPATKLAASPTKAAPRTSLKNTPTTPKSPAVKTTTLSKTTSAPVASPKPTATAKPSPKPRVPAASKVTEKKPLLNGDVKPIKRPISAPTTTKPATPPARTMNGKLSPTKTGEVKPLERKPATARPITAPAIKPPISKAAPAPKPRPTSLLSKTTTAATKTSTVTTTKITGTTKSPLTTSPKAAFNTVSKPKPTSAPPRPRVPLTKTIAKSPDAEKQNKEAVNKQITASRTNRTVGSTTTRTTTTTTVPPIRKIESKAPTTRTTVTKMTTTTLKSAGTKKPVELTRHIISKTKATTKTLKSEQNGIVETTVNEMRAETLVKDPSPIEGLIIDNSQLPETNIAD